MPRRPSDRAVYFDSPAAFRRWLEAHHASAVELLVGFHKRHTARPTLTWSEAVDEALCFGWIDGVRRRVDDERYTIRFTPRKRGSNWSLVNIRKAETLLASGRMTPAGQQAFEARRADRSGLYAFEQREAPQFTAAERRRFKLHASAWRFFDAQPPGYRRTATFWVVTAKRESTRAARLDRLIADSDAGLRVGPFRRP